MNNMPSSKVIDRAWKTLILTQATGKFPFSIGDTVAWNEFRHNEFMAIGIVLDICKPTSGLSDGYCCHEGSYYFLGSTKTADFRMEIKPKQLYDKNLISYTFNGDQIYRIRPARVVLIEKTKKIDIYKNNE